MRRHGVPPIRRLVLCAVVAFPGTLLFAAVIYLNYFGAVDRASLGHSVGSQLDGAGGCDHLGGARWQCSIISVAPENMWGPYTVVVSGQCWHGRLTQGVASEGGPARISGCVGVWDHLRLGDRFPVPSLTPPGYS